VAVKKKPAVKKTAAKKKPAVKKTAAKKTVAKKSAVKKTVAKKRTVKKTVAKKSVVKKSAVKKTAKKAVKKSAAKKRSASASSIVIPPVPSSVGAGRVDVSSTPKSAARNNPAPAKTSKPSEAPKQGSSGKVLVAIIVAIILLAVIVVTRPDSDSDDAAPTPAATATATPTEEATEEPAVEPTEAATSAPVESVEGPATVGNWKDSAKRVMTISWKAPAASAGLTGYKVEVRVNRGEWAVKSEVPADQLSIDFSKTSATGETAFRVSSIYSDGQEAVGNTFGFSGVFE
jgi:outer membrane biosynthesis protein TonB